MASAERLGGHREADGTHARSADDTAAAEAALQARLSRKRTKTGCLTCRKRRIKCGEERPVCGNCVKSKRHCEGYSQRVTFKPPTFEFRPTPHGSAHIVFQAGPVAEPVTPFVSEQVYQGNQFGAQSQLRPKPVEHFAPDDPYAGRQLVTRPPPPQLQPQYNIQINTGSQYLFVGPPDAGQPLLPQPAFSILGLAQQRPLPAIGSSQRAYVPQALDHDVEISQAAASRVPRGPQLPISDVAEQRPLQPGFRPEQWQEVGRNMPKNEFEAVVPSPVHDYASVSSVQARGAQITWQSSVPLTYIPRPEPSQPLDAVPLPFSTDFSYTQPQFSTSPAAQPLQHNTPEFYEHELHVAPSNTPTYILTEAAVEVHDDDYYDVHSDDEMDVDTVICGPNDVHGQRTLNTILDRNQITIQELRTRRYDTFIYNGMLDHYRVEGHANPLRNPATARVFAHFIAVTGPSLSIFERHPRNTSVLFTEGHIPFSQQGLWTYTMPMAALHNQGLLHAMLALASLHIARLTGASVTPSMHHYGWALKRIHHSVGHEKKRLKVATVAASMLLGFYEIMTADHMKWNAHLAGSKQLFVETDFVRMTQQFRRLKIERAAQQGFGRMPSLSSSGSSQEDMLDQVQDVDERIVSIFVGREVRYGDAQGQIMTPQSSIPAQLDLSKFEILKDLYWWYCKQDIYQSIVSGNPLLMDYSRWANCPPRAPLGNPSSVYGSFDHLMLLLARIADFASGDRVRKLRKMELNGGQWRPAPGMNIPRPPQPQPAPPQSAQSNHATPDRAAFTSQSPVPPPVPQGPMFYGMAPPPRQGVKMPSSYTPLNNPPPPVRGEPHDITDLHVATEAALKEYDEIRKALRIFSSSLGEAFQPLSSEYQPPIESPFGPALLYRTYDIGCLWAVYDMAVIIAIRSHPHMPPAAHMAAGVAAQQTAHFAREIGRIAAGIVPGPPDQPLNPSLGAALCESCMPSFFAAVQYQEPDQRRATVTRIFSIAQRTGWGSADLIANGCETSWVKAAAAGRGPPYQRIARNQRSYDPRMNGSWEHLDPNSQPDEEDEGDRRLIKMRPTARLNWAIGIMGTEDDIAA
ncbi:hypothetical protein LTR08_004849 [Meristemomyces frigidus]|nr:hypothetical protein LTR08_004849 [Meristemomyces frigidus]